jgi:hypothetical protein
MVYFPTKIPTWVNFGWPRLENADIFYGLMECLMDIRDILGLFVTFSVHLVHFFRFWYHVQKKSGNTDALKHLIRATQEES